MHRAEKYTKLFQTKLAETFCLHSSFGCWLSCRCSQRVYSAIEAKKYLITIVLVFFFLSLSSFLGERKVLFAFNSVMEFLRAKRAGG